MAEIEVGFKVKQSLKQCIELLNNAHYEPWHKADTHDLYFSNQELKPEMTEENIKRACVRIRHCNGGYSIDNYGLVDGITKHKINCSKDVAGLIEEVLIKNGYRKILDTKKTDYVYKKGNCYHQLQDIKVIEKGVVKSFGLLDYIEDKDIKDKSEDEQFEILKQKMLNEGFELEFDLGVDKLRTILANDGKFRLSKSQTAMYDSQNEQEQDDGFQPS